jgi:hypothetical protein
MTIQLGTYLFYVVGALVLFFAISLLCRSKTVRVVKNVRVYTAIGTKDVQAGERVRSRYYSNETGYKLMD